MHSLWNSAAKLLIVMPLLLQPAGGAETSPKAADVVLRELADQTANQLVQNDLDAVYASMSPKLKLAYSRDELLNPASGMQTVFGHIQSRDFEAINYGKRGVGGEWIRIVMYWYHVKTDKYPEKTYLKVEVTQEQGHYYIAGYSMERVLLGGKLPFLKH